MKELTWAGAIKFKGILFLVVGVVASGLLLLEAPTLKVGVLLGISVWCFCRFYYCAFYVIEKYVDPGFRFSGLGAFGRYLWKSSKRPTSKLQ